MNRLWCVLLLVTLTSAACQPVATAVPAPATTTVSPTAAATATSTPEPSPVPPTPTVTSPPAERFFTEDFDRASPYWSFPQVDTGQPAEPPQIDGGFLVFQLPAPNQWLYGVYQPFHYADVRVDAAVQVRLGSHGTPGLVCRYDEQQGWYEFDIHDDQTYVLLFGQWLADGVARYTPLVQAESEKIQPGQNEIGLLCEGDVLTPFVNGTQLRRREERTFGLTTGKIGVAASSFQDAPEIIAYDWVRVSSP